MGLVTPKERLAPGWEGVVGKVLRRRRGFGLADRQSTDSVLFRVKPDQPADASDLSSHVGEIHRLADADATRALGRDLATRWLSQSPRAGIMLLLKGDLGAGKTCLVQGLAEGLGIEEPITSPTFALAQHYSGIADGAATALVHLDLYRLDQPTAADELLAQEEEQAMASDGLLAVEWPERLSRCPAGAWQVELVLLDHRDPDRGRQAAVQFEESRPPDDRR
jgi:tRNA threonylcarbamoyladenosine biosynthesis protein TsaE